MSKAKEFVNSIVSGDTATAQSSFSSMIRDKVRTVIEIKKVELTSNIYNRPAQKED